MIKATELLFNKLWNIRTKAYRKDKESFYRNISNTKFQRFIAASYTNIFKYNFYVRKSW